MKRWLSAQSVGFFAAALVLCLAAAQPAAAVCGNGILEAGEQCDDGNVIAGDCCSNLCLFEVGPGTPPCCNNGICGVGQLCASGCGFNAYCHYSGGPPSVCQCKSDVNAPPLDHYRVYAAVGGLPTQVVTMRDQFQTQRTNLSNVEFFMVPANKNDEGIFDPVPHLTCYGTPEGTFGATVSVTNQFGPQTLLIKQPDLLCVPSEKFPDPVPVPLNRDHYKCYEAQGNPLNIQVSLQDQFHLTPEVVTVLDPFEFCAPVDKNAEGILNPREHLTCYNTTPSGPIVGTVPIRNQFGNDTLNVAEPVALCVPSLKTNVTVVPCATAEAPKCNGSCPPGAQCTDVGGACQCL